MISRLKNIANRVTGKDRSANIAHAGKWTFYFIMIGLIAGLGSIVFHYLCQLGLHYFLDFMAGYRPPSPAGEHHLITPTSTPFNRWILFGTGRIFRNENSHLCFRSYRPRSTEITGQRIEDRIPFRRCDGTRCCWSGIAGYIGLVYHTEIGLPAGNGARS